MATKVSDRRAPAEHWVVHAVLTSSDGSRYELRAELERGPVVLLVYRNAW